MGIRIVKDWPKTASEKAVKRWMDKKGIDFGDVHSYKVYAAVGDAPVITVTMSFDEDVEE